MISIAASLMVIYYDCAGVVPNGSRRQRKSSFLMIAMHFDVISEFAWIYRYVTYILAACVRFKENTDVLISLLGFFKSHLVVFTINDVFDYCF